MTDPRRRDDEQMAGKRVVIVGGGAAGMMAAATIAEERPGARVTLLERNPRLGAKVIISGGGRCNVTTGVLDAHEALSRYPRGARWLQFAMHSFPPRRVIEWFEQHGVPLKTEPDLRVFPVSDNGRDVVAAFDHVFAGRVDVRLRSMVASISREDDRFRIETADGAEPGGPFDAVILTTGGAAFRHTGSTGDGYRFARALGHTVTPLYPSLNAYVVAEDWAKSLSGLSFQDAELSIPAPMAGSGPTRLPRLRRADSRLPRPPAYRGAFLFTHFGVTGPAVFALCSLAATRTYGPDDPMPLCIDLLPSLTAEQVDGLLRERFTSLGGREVVNALDTLLPRSICPALCGLAGIDPVLRAAQLSRDARRRLAGLIHALALTIVGRRNGEEFVTAGGVATDEVDPRTMASRVCSGLFLAGEVLDVDGFTGGYNLQAAWATGRLAGLAAAARA